MQQDISSILQIIVLDAQFPTVLHALDTLRALSVPLVMGSPILGRALPVHSADAKPAPALPNAQFVKLGTL